MWARPAAEDPGGPGGPPRRKKSRSGASGLRRAFSWLRGKRRKKKAAGAEGAESAAPRAKKADDKARRAKGKGRGKAAGHLGCAPAAPRVRPGWLRWGSGACWRGEPLGAGAGGAETPGLSSSSPSMPPPLISQIHPDPILGGRDPWLGQESPGLSRKCWQSGSWDGEAIPPPPGSPRFCPLLSQGVRDLALASGPWERQVALHLWWGFLQVQKVNCALKVFQSHKGPSLGHSLL